jgi:hypothetical protein
MAGPSDALPADETGTSDSVMSSSRAYEIVGRLILAMAWTTMGVASQACAPAAGAAIGVGARQAESVYSNSRGAKSIVDGSVENVNARTQKALSHMHVQITEKDVEGEGRKYKGTKGGEEVTVTLARNDANTTTVEVNAQRSELSWDKDLAKEILVRIIETKA